LPNGRWVGCRHLTADGKVVGFNAAKAHKSKDPAQGFVAHDH
jgi:hypothetical protein